MSLVLAFALVGPSVAGANAGNTDRPIKATESGTAVFDLNTFASVQDLTGTESHLGRITVHNAGTLSLGAAGFTITGSTTTIAANGDELLGTFIATGANDSQGNASGQLVITITGGTGRFTGASGTQTGSFTTESVSVIGPTFTGITTLSIVGTISY